ncbi:hypothetical protein PYL56_08020 [Staphylococcus succinus]|uniref:hypothetical protein n=1 Tax=Staphylococcus succinus TaxID=61015 RepID=UPI00248169ED|nr:hypothetical protein [Staphylococcus succinus]MDH9161313.1 hypothetical protein [Staphylococcus succinus]
MRVIYNKTGGQSTLLFDDEEQFDTEKYTLDVPPNGLYQPINYIDGKWVGITKEEWEAARPEPEPIIPSTAELMIANLQIQVINHETKMKSLEEKYNEVRAELNDLKGSAE